MQKPRALLFVLAGAVWLLVPSVIFGQSTLVPCDGVGCNLCSFGQLLQNIINFLIWLSVFIAVAMFAYAGFLYATGGTSEPRITLAHKLFKDVFIGFLIAISAWLVVQTVISTVFDGNFFVGGNWNKLQCTKESLKDTTVADWINSVIPNVSAPAGGVQTGGSTSTSQTPALPADNQYSYDPGIQAQNGHMSPALFNLLTCMAPKIPGNAGRISSISDSAIVSGTATFQSCAAGTGMCAHTRNSCHYGGTACVGKSYAVDFGDQENTLVLTQAAQQCGGSVINEGNHLHVSVGGSCGCN